MKIITFKNISIEGFRSIVNMTIFSLDRPGLNLIKGINGGGKTTLFDALVWCVYGINLKDTVNERIPSWKETRTADWKGTYVEVKVIIDGVTYLIIRTIEWVKKSRVGKNDLQILREVSTGEYTEVTDQGVHKKDVQKQIDDMLGMDSRTFMNSILFGQRMAKLVESANNDKRDLFEKLFETSFINQSKKNAMDSRAELDEDLIKQEADERSLTSRANALEDEILRGKQLLEDFGILKQEKIDAIKQKINHVDQTIASHEQHKISYQKTIDGFDEKAYYDKVKLYEEQLKVIAEHEKSIQDIKSKLNPLYTKMTNLSEQSKSHADQLRSIAGAEEVFDESRRKQITGLQNEIKEQIDRRTKELNEIDDICPTCSQKFPDDKLQMIKDKTANKYKSLIDKLEIDLAAAKADKYSSAIDPESLKTAMKELDTITIPHLSDEITVLEVTLNGVQEIFAPMLDILQPFTDELAELDDYFENVYNPAIEALRQTDGFIEQEKAKKEIFNTQLEAQENELPPKIDIPSLKMRSSALASELKITQENIATINERLTHIEWWIRTGFASAGLPAYVFKSMLTRLNENVQKYAVRLGVAVEFSVDLTKVSKPFTTVCSVGDKLNKEYKEFSGGQKQRLDIVLIFAMHDLISYNSNINVLILDEIFEGVDENGEAAVFDLIRMKADEGKSIYIITHSPHIDSLYSTTIEIEVDEVGRTLIKTA